MNFRLSLDLSTDGRIFGGFHMTINWAAEAAEKLRSRMADRRVSDKKLLEERKRLEEQGPALWIGVCEEIKRLVLELNENYGSVIVRVKDRDLNQLEARFELSGRTTDLKVTFEPTTSQYALKWVYTGDLGRDVKSGSCPLYIDNGRVVFQQALIKRTPASLAEEMLDNLISE